MVVTQFNKLPSKAKKPLFRFLKDIGIYEAFLRFLNYDNSYSTKTAFNCMSKDGVKYFEDVLYCTSFTSYLASLEGWHPCLFIHGQGISFTTISSIYVYWLIVNGYGANSERYLLKPTSFKFDKVMCAFIIN